MTTPTPPPAPVADKLGPGVLKFGETGSMSDWSGQVTKMELNPSVDSEDDLPVLSGGTLTGDRNYTYELAGEVLQDHDAGKLIRWSWLHKGQEVPFVFTPVDGFEVTGVVVVDPLKLGGDVKKRNTSAFTYAIVGDPDVPTD